MRNINIDNIKISDKLDETVNNAILEGFEKNKKVNKNKKFKKKVVASVAALAIGTIAFNGLFPAYAKDIPVIGNIFSYLNENYIGYKEFSDSIEMTENSDGIDITLNDAIYDGRTIMITYTIKTDKDLGEDIYINGSDLNIRGYYGGMSGSSGVYKVKDKDNTYVGFTRLSLQDAENELDVSFKIRKLHSLSNDTEIKGKWDFKFRINKIDGNIKTVNKSIEKNGVKFTLENIVTTPIGTIISYNQQNIGEDVKKYDEAYVSLVEVKDDLGNVYKGEENGGGGTKDNMNFSSTYGKINPNATKLIITPKVELSVIGEDGNRMLGTEVLKENDPKINEYLKKKGIMPQSFTLDDIIIDLK